MSGTRKGALNVEEQVSGQPANGTRRARTPSPGNGCSPTVRGGSTLTPQAPPEPRSGHRHSVHGATPVAAKQQHHSQHDHDHDHHHDKPDLAQMCTRCAHGGEKPTKPPPAADDSNFIILSQSFQDYTKAEIQAQTKSAADEVASSASTMPSGGSPSSKPLFPRWSIVREEILPEATGISQLYDVTVGTLGKGSYGSVVKARHLKTGVIRAVKIVYKPRIENLTRLKREILIMKRLDHPNIIKLFEVYEDQKNLYLIMELCTGGELFDRIIKSGHFSERYAANIMRQVFGAISYCHASDVMHRDLKPENLLFADASPLSALKVIDWGFAAKCGKDHKFTSVVGTPYYVAPEVLFGSYDKQCDIWSAGVILYILLCGYPPFHGKDNKEILRKVKIGDYSFEPQHWKRVSDPGKDLVRRLLTYDPRKRLAAADALQHPWLQYYTSSNISSDTPLSNKLGDNLLEKFRNFQRHTKLKKLAITVVAYHTSERDIGALNEMFAALDTNGDGVLTVQEVSHGLSSVNVKFGAELEDLLRELDTDGNGTLDYTEFLAASIDHKLYEQESVCMSAFKVFDLDGDGKITIDEMHKVLEMSFVQEQFTREMIEEMIREVDINNDGSIDFDEFMRMMRGNQKKKYDGPAVSAFSKARALLYHDRGGDSGT
eukprot:Polyplicarium_translucidae@DN1633_c0_g1_i1.p1